MSWIVMIGDLYIGGLGSAFRDPACVGYVMTKIRDHAQAFSSLETARGIASKLGGRVLAA